MNDHEQWLAVALEAAAEAGAYLRSHWLTTHTIHYKGHRDLVTEADIASEALILTHLRTAFPHHAILSEEGGGAELAEAPVCWMIDPVDGTSNFSHNLPSFCLSIAAVEEGEPVVGVVYDPIRDHCFAARRGNGATLNGQPIHVSGISEPGRTISAVDWPRTNVQREQMLQLTGLLLSHGHSLRALGTSALAITYLAAGWLDFYAALSLKPWDQAAAVLLVREAGGTVETFSRQPWTPHAPDPLIAASPALLNTFRELLEKGASNQ